MKSSALSRATPYLLIAPAHLLVFAIILVPSIFILHLSLHSSSFGEAPVFVGWQNYVDILTDLYFWRSMLNTAVITIVVVHVEILVALGWALLFASGVPFRPILIAVVLAPYAVTDASAAVMWQFLLDPQYGWIGQLIGALGLPPLDWTVTPAHGIAVISMLAIWLNLPFTFVIIYAARLAVPKDLYESSAIDGATPFQQFLNVTLPLLLPAMLVAMLFRYIFAFRLFSEVWLMTGGGPVRTTEAVGVYLYLEAFRYHSFGTAAATGWLMVLATFGLALVYLRSVYKQMFSNAA